MGNTFINIKEIARRSMDRLVENLVFPELCYRDYSNDFVNGKGDTIQVRKPVTLTASDFSSTVSAQDAVEGSVDVKLDTLSDVTVEFSTVQNAVNMGDGALERLFINPAAYALAERINHKGLALAADIPYFVGTCGTTPDGLDDFANAAKVLDEHKVPTDERFAVWNPAAMAKFRQLGDLVNAEKSGTTDALRTGSIGNVFGLNSYMTQGILETAKATGAGTVKIDNASGYDAGDTEIHVDGVTTALAAGDLLSIGGNLYTVKTAGALSTADQDITLTYGLLADVADNADVTIVTASYAAINNMAFHRNAFAFVSRPLATPAGAESYVVSYNGLSLRVVRQYNISAKKDMLSMDILYGYKTLDPKLAVRILG